MNRLQERYQTELKNDLFQQLELGNINLVPKLEKIIISSGVGRATQDDKHLQTVTASLAKISGQKPVETRAKHSVATFKLREGNKIGAKVTLRGERMWYFLDLLISVVLPRLRDFRGLPNTAFDGHGNYNIGLPEQSVFPEIGYEDITEVHGLQITLVTSAKTDEAARALISALGLPLERSA